MFSGDAWKKEYLGKFLLQWVCISAAAWLVAAFAQYVLRPGIPCWFLGWVPTVAIPIAYFFGDLLAGVKAEGKSATEQREEQRRGASTEVAGSGAGDGGTGGAGDAGE